MQLLDDTIELLVPLACTLDFDDLVIAVARWESLADELGTGDRHERAHRHRSAHLHVGEFGFTLDADGGTAAGMQLQEILDAFTHAEFLHDWEAGVAEHGDGMCPALLERTDAFTWADLGRPAEHISFTDHVAWRRRGPQRSRTRAAPASSCCRVTTTVGTPGIE